MDLRAQLQELAHRLHHEDDEAAKQLGAEVQRRVDEDDHHGLGERLNESAAEFETSHPDLSAFLLRIADALSASGL